MMDNNQNNFSNEMNTEYLGDSNKVQELNVNAGKKKGSFNIILAILSVIIIALVAFLVYYIISMRKPEKVFTNITNHMFNSVENLIGNNANLNLEESGLITGNLKINTTVEDYEFLNNEVFNYSLGYDIKNKKAELGFGFDEDNQKVIFAEAEVKDNNLYFYLDDLFDKVILLDDATIQKEIEVSINDIFTTIEEYLKEDKREDVLYIVEQFQLINNKALKNLKYEKTSEKLNVNGKEINTTKMVLNLNKENTLTIMNTYINEMLNNESLTDKLTSLLEISKDYYIETLNSIKKEIDLMENAEDFEEAILSIYTNGLFSNIVKIGYEIDNEEYMYYINYEDYKAIYCDDFLIEVKNKDLSAKYDDELIISGTANSLELNNLDIEFKSEDKEIPFKGNVKFINENDKLNFLVNVEVTTETVIKFKIDLNNSKVNDKEYSSIINYALEADSQKMELTNTMKILLGSEIASNEVSNTINYNDLTDNDITMIEENLTTKLENSKLGELIISNQLDTSKSFARKSNEIIDSALDAVSLIDINSLSSEYYTKEGTETYCFTVSDLINTGFLDSEYYTIEGTITVTKLGNSYIYRTELIDENFYVKKYSGSVTENDVYELDSYYISSIKTSCTPLYNTPLY